MQLKKTSICGQFALTTKNTRSYWDPNYHVVEESFFLSCPIHHINMHVSLWQHVSSLALLQDKNNHSFLAAWRS